MKADFTDVLYLVPMDTYLPNIVATGLSKLTEVKFTKKLYAVGFDSNSKQQMLLGILEAFVLHYWIL